LYSIRPDGTGLLRLSNGEWEDVNAAWSPDGRKIAFSSSRDNLDESEIYVMDDDGSDVRRLTTIPGFDYGPSWSPDGRNIVFTHKGEGPREIFLMRADGSRVRKVPIVTVGDGLIGGNDWPSFMGDDRLLVHHREDTISDSFLFTVKLDGSHLRQLTPNNLQAGPAAWTSRGHLITFENNYCSGCDFAHIYTMRDDGTRIRQIENVEGNNNLFPQWSPDGRKVTFSSFSLTSPVFAYNNIHTIDADGGNELDVTNNPYDNYQSSWGCPGSSCR
jgi:Tol biopolymer transport system component